MQVLRSGDVVRVRQERWRVAGVRSYSCCEVVALVGVGPLNFGIERSVVTPFDIVEPFVRPSRLRVVGIRRWRRACRVLLSKEGPPDGLLTARSARIDLLPYQLEPALAVLRGLTSRILIADEVGLGKTVQAALAVAELRARGAADRVLIVAPAGLRDQWRDEFRDRFSIHVSVVDAREMRRRVAGSAVGVNPWSTVPVAVTSFDYVKRPEVLAAVDACRWDVVVVDEAHGAAPGTGRHDAVATLCAAASCVILLTATPHSGDPRAFAALRQLGACADDPLVVFRRRRAEVGITIRRRIHRLLVQPSAAERLMHTRLDEFSRAVAADRGRDGDVRLALATLHKRALSSPWSLRQSVRRRLAFLGRPAAAAAQQHLLPLHEDGNEDGDAADEAPSWTSRGLPDARDELEKLAAIEEAARQAVHAESKVRVLIRLLDHLRRRSEQAIVFTEYRDTLLHLRSRLLHPCAIIHGGLTRDERRTALSEFASGRCPVLLATDAAGEGLNLHAACRVVINLELPWSPVRLEQRAGRVDRIGQQRAVHVFHLIAAATPEMRVLDRLTHRVTRARRDIDVADPLDLLPDVWLEERDDEDDDEPVGGPRPSLAGAAAQEHARLVRARALRPHLDRGDDGVPAGPLLAFTDRQQTRVCLRGSALVLAEAALEDGCGRRVASRLSATAVRLAVPVRGVSRNTISHLWQVLDPAVRELCGNDDDRFATAAIGLHRAFWEARLRREQAVAARFTSTGATPLQPGLFDRRAVDQHESARQARADWLTDSERRVAGIGRVFASAVKTSRVVLVLVP